MVEMKQRVQNTTIFVCNLAAAIFIIIIIIRGFFLFSQIVFSLLKCCWVLRSQPKAGQIVSSQREKWNKNETKPIQVFAGTETTVLPLQ